MISALVQRFLGRWGLELRRSSGRASLEGSLRQAQQAGLRPATVLDVGAAFGGVSRLCGELFPQANLLAVEALREYAPSLEAALPRRPNARILWAAAGSRAGAATFHVHADFVGSSLYREAEGEATDGEPREVPVVTLDDACRDAGFGGPYLLKVDVQGAELDVLQGASAVLAETDYAVLEVSLFQFFLGGPQITEIIRFMADRGFVPYDIFGLQYRLLDGALSQTDMVFVKADGLFRRDHRYATPQQRRAQNAEMRSARQPKAGPPL